MRITVTNIVEITNVKPLYNKRYAHIEFLIEVLEVSDPLAGIPKKYQTYTWLVWDYVDRKLKFSADLHLGSDSKSKVPPKADITSVDENCLPIIIYEKLKDLNTNIGMYFDAFIYSESRPLTVKVKDYIEKNGVNVEKWIIDFDI